MLVPLLFLVFHSTIYASNTLSADTINIWSSVINLSLVSLYILSIAPRGYKNKIVCFGLVAIINMSLFTVPEIGSLVSSNISVYASLFIVMILAIRNAITPGNKHNELVKIIVFTSFIIGIFYSGPKVIKGIMEKNLADTNLTDRNVIATKEKAAATTVQQAEAAEDRRALQTQFDASNTKISEFVDNITEIGNNSWPALIIGVVIFIVIERFIMNPYVITKVPFRPTKEDFFANELHEKIS